MNKFEARRFEIEELSVIYNYLEQRLNDLSRNFQVVGKKQRTKYKAETGEYEPVWEDEEHTIPSMTDDWDYVDLSDDELSEENLTKKAVVKKLMEYLEKLA